MEIENLLAPRVAARVLGTTPYHLQQFVRDGVLKERRVYRPHNHADSWVYYDRADLERLLGRPLTDGDLIAARQKVRRANTAAREKTAAEKSRKARLFVSHEASEAAR